MVWVRVNQLATITSLRATRSNPVTVLIHRCRMDCHVAARLAVTVFFVRVTELATTTSLRATRSNPVTALIHRCRMDCHVAARLAVTMFFVRMTELATTTSLRARRARQSSDGLDSSTLDGLPRRSALRNEVFATTLSLNLLPEVTPYTKAVLSSPHTSAELKDTLRLPVLSQYARTQWHTAR